LFHVEQFERRLPEEIGGIRVLAWVFSGGGSRNGIQAPMKKHPLADQCP
jgi:hypothetical protein